MLPEMARGKKRFTTTFALENRIHLRRALGRYNYGLMLRNLERPIIITVSFGKNSMHSTSPTGQIPPYLALSSLSKSRETSVAGLE